MNLNVLKPARVVAAMLGILALSIVFTPSASAGCGSGVGSIVALPEKEFRSRFGKGVETLLVGGTTLVPVCRVYLNDARVDHYGGLAIRGDTGKGAHGRSTQDSEPIETG